VTDDAYRVRAETNPPHHGWKVPVEEAGRLLPRSSSVKGILPSELEVGDETREGRLPVRHPYRAATARPRVESISRVHPQHIERGSCVGSEARHEVGREKSVVLKEDDPFRLAGLDCLLPDSKVGEPEAEVSDVLAARDRETGVVCHARLHSDQVHLCSSRGLEEAFPPPRGGDAPVLS